MGWKVGKTTMLGSFSGIIKADESPRATPIAEGCGRNLKGGSCMLSIPLNTPVSYHHRSEGR